MGFILLMGFIVALPTTFNPFTGKLDFYSAFNQTCTAGDFLNQIFLNGTFGCGTPIGGGDITSVQGDLFIVNGSDSGNVILNFNTTLAGTNLSVNSSDFWDALDSPSDINAGDITDDNTYVTVTGDTMTGALNIDVGSSTGTSFQTGDVTGGQDYLLAIKSALIGDAVPDFSLILDGSSSKWPQFQMVRSTFDTFDIDFEGEPGGVEGWVIATSDDTIRIQPGNNIFQVEGKFQIGQPFATEIGGSAGFVEWFHDGTDGFITSSLGKIFIPQLELGGASLGTFGDSTAEVDVRRTVSDLNNTDVTGVGTIQVGGDGSFATDLTYKIEITTGGEIGTAVYRWSDDGGSTWDVENLLTSISPRNMNNGLKVWFVGASGTDFNANDFATITAIGTNNQKNTFIVDTTNNRIGINTLTPQNTLNIVGDLNVTGTSYLNSFTISDDLIVGNINISGLTNRIGIGTLTPASALEVIGLIRATNWTNVSITESQIMDLQTYAINNTAGWILNFSEIYSQDWTNISITESQISDLRSYILSSSEANLNVNSSDFWDGINTPADFSTITASGLITGGEFSGLINWTFLQNYPAACPSGTFLTQLDDSVTCTAPVANDVDPGDFPAGNYSFDTNVLFIDSSNNRVGIGDTTPSFTLDVSGTSQITGNLTLKDDLVMDQDDRINLGAGNIHYNGTCVIIKGSAATLEIC